MTRNSEFAHYGVKGMKWGVRKKKDAINARDRTLKKGTDIQRVALGDKHDSSLARKSGRIYASYTDYDNAYYAKYYSKQLAKQKNAKVSDVSVQSFRVKKDVKIASDRQVLKTLTEMAKNNPKQLANDFGSAAKASEVLSRINQKYWDKQVSALAKGGETKAGYAAAQRYVQLAAFSESMKSGSWAHFTRSMMKSGYGAISDANDRDGLLNAQDPLIILDVNSVHYKGAIPVSSYSAKTYINGLTQKNLKQVTR